MNRYVIKESTLTGMADAVRNKTDSDDAMTPAEMTAKIMSIRTFEGDPVLEGVSITPTGEEIVKVPPNGVDGFGVVTVEGDPNLSPENIKSGVTIYGVEGKVTEGIDTSDATAVADDIMEGASAYVNGELIVGTHVCEGEPILAQLVVSPTGTEFVEVPEDGVDGFDEVTVIGDDNLLPENIKKDVTIYGVTGELDGGEMQVVEMEITENKEYSIIPDADYNGMSEVKLNVNVLNNLYLKRVEITENAPMVVMPEEGYDGFTHLLLAVDVPANKTCGYAYPGILFDEILTGGVYDDATE